MGHLGELGKPKDLTPDTFGWFGHTIRVGPSFTNLRLIDFMDEAGAIDEEDMIAGMKAMRDFLHLLVDEEDWDTFWAASLDNGQTVEDLIELTQALTAREANRPTRRRSDSSAGRRKTGGKSKGDSSSPVTLRLARQGRPDLAIAAEMAQTAREARRVG